MTGQHSSTQFETEEHRRAEKAFAERIEKRFNCAYIKLPMNWQIDGILSRHGQGIALAELKCRAVSSGTYPDIVLSYHKARSALKLSSVFANSITGKSTPFIFFVAFIDGDYWFKVTQEYVVNPVPFEPKNHDVPDPELIIRLPKKLFNPFN